MATFLDEAAYSAHFSCYNDIVSMKKVEIGKSCCLLGEFTNFF